MQRGVLNPGGKVNPFITRDSSGRFESTGLSASLKGMTPSEAKTALMESDIPPDDLTINGKDWKLECTYLSRKEAMDSAEMMDTYRLFKYPQGYALYERRW